MDMIISEKRLRHLRRLSEQLQEKMRTERLYLQPHLTLTDVAESLNVCRNDVSYVVNTYIGKSFVDYINELRMEEAVRLMQSPTEERRTISELGRLAGFSDRTTFCRICKKIKGVSPTELETSFTNR